MKKIGKIKSVLYKFGPTQIIAIGFFAIILVGAVLLSLPISAKSGNFTPFTDALFTSASATCITGLVVYDTATYWSIFGQIVIISLIQIGGIGFMTVASLISFMARRKITLRERLIMVESLNYSQIQGVVRMYRNVLLVTFITEFAGAAVLCTRFIPEFGISGIYKAIFTSISAFCNAGFDVFGTPEAEFVNMTVFAGDPIVNITLMVLIVVGGLGFFVISNLTHSTRKSDLQVHTKLVLIMTAILILTGAAIFFALEYNNPQTMGNMSIGEKIMAAFFQSVTTRTAGFNTVSQAGLMPVSKLVSVILMFIGGSPGSTAGGVKTVTIAILIMTVVSSLRKRRDVVVFRKRIAEEIVRKATAITVIAAVIICVATVIISLIEDVSLAVSLYEVTSAYCTVGLSADLTPTLGTSSKLILTLLMFVGRVGSMTLAMAAVLKTEDEKIRYPEAKVMIG